MQKCSDEALCGDAACSQDVYGKVQQELQQIDVYRDTPIRYLGYANEVGESFRSMIPTAAVKATYVAAFGYACADALDKGRMAYKKPWDSEEERRKAVALSTLDTLIWQSLASVAIPGFTINRICHFSALALKKTTSWPSPLRKWIVTAIGLGSIPFIVKPIDAAVEIGMDETVRKYYEVPHRMHL